MIQYMVELQYYEELADFAIEFEKYFDEIYKILSTKGDERSESALAKLKKFSIIYEDEETEIM